MFGHRQVIRLRERYDLARYPVVYACGDSDEDREMLDIAHGEVLPLAQDQRGSLARIAAPGARTPVTASGLSASGRGEAMHTAVSIARPGGAVGRVGRSPGRDDSEMRSRPSTEVSPLPAVRHRRARTSKSHCQMSAPRDEDRHSVEPDLD
jgi:hypothetical protein